jgi:hypothetical protein
MSRSREDDFWSGSTGQEAPGFFADEESAESSEAAPAGPKQLKPKQSRLVAFGFLFLFATFWNLVVGVFLVQLLFRPQVLLAVFLIPFLLIGLVLVALVVYTFLGLFNPVPQLVIREGHLVPGTSTEVSWSFRGSTHNIRLLKLILVGKEVATYRRGTKTHTDEHEFCVIPFLETSTPHQIASGTATCHIPDRTMHSFTARNNRIEWFIRVHGDVPRFPDIREEFPITVYAS